MYVKNIKVIINFIYYFYYEANDTTTEENKPNIQKVIDNGLVQVILKIYF